MSERRTDMDAEPEPAARWEPPAAPPAPGPPQTPGPAQAPGPEQGAPAWLSSAALGLLLLAMVGFFGPQHTISRTSVSFCWAPDCRSSVSRYTETCGGMARLTKEPFPDLLIPLILVVIAMLQIPAGLRKQRRPVIIAGAFTMGGALAMALVLSYHAVIGHLLSKTHSQWGEILTGLTATLLIAVGAIQLFSNLKRPPPAPTRQEPPRPGI